MPPPEHFNAFDGVKSLPSVLNTAGYQTGIIGKYHLGPDYPWFRVYNFSYGLDAPNCCSFGGTCEHEFGSNTYNVFSRNITYMRECAKTFFESAAKEDDPFFLYVGFGDSHRCGGAIGSFCENFGSGGEWGVIPDWKPVQYNSSSIPLPFFVPDTEVSREDMAKQYTATNRLDQGVGLILEELQAAGLDDETYIFYFSDNGIPWPVAKTNLYEPGMHEPLLVSPPGGLAEGRRCNALVSELDFMPTILEIANVSLAPYWLVSGYANFTGRSILPLLTNDAVTACNSSNDTLAEAVFASHQTHEIPMYYPMRAVRTDRYKLIWNIGYQLPYPIAGDLWESPPFIELEYNIEHNLPTNWYKV